MNNFKICICTLAVCVYRCTDGNFMMRYFLLSIFVLIRSTVCMYNSSMVKVRVRFNVVLGHVVPGHVVLSTGTHPVVHVNSLVRLEPL